MRHISLALPHIVGVKVQGLGYRVLHSGCGVDLVVDLARVDLVEHLHA